MIDWKTVINVVVALVVYDSIGFLAGAFVLIVKVVFK